MKRNLRRLSSAALRLALAPLRAAPGALHSRVGVVLGCPVGEGPGLLPGVRARVDAGIELYHAGQLDRLVFSGGAPHGRAEAPAMAAYAEERGVPKSAIVIEDESRTTAENAARCADLLLPAHRSIVLISEPYHLRRGLLWFRRYGFDPVAMPTRGPLDDGDLGRAARTTAREYGAWVATGWRLLQSPKR